MTLPRIEHIPDAEYFADTSALTRTMLMDFRESPRRFQQWYVTKEAKKPEPKNPRVDIGTVAHLALIQPHKFDELVVEIPEDVLASNGAKSTKAYRAWSEENAGRIQLKADQIAIARKMADALLKDFGDLFTSASRIENTVTWEDQTGLLCKAKLDVLYLGDPSRILDVKTTADCSPAFFRKRVESGYWMQDAHYTAGIEALTGTPCEFYFVAADETGNPPACYRLSAKDRVRAEGVYRETMQSIFLAYQTNDWACPWEEKIVELSLKDWAYE